MTIPFFMSKIFVVEIHPECCLANVLQTPVKAALTAICLAFANQYPDGAAGGHIFVLHIL